LNDAGGNSQLRLQGDIKSAKRFHDTLVMGLYRPMSLLMFRMLCLKVGCSVNMAGFVLIGDLLFMESNLLYVSQDTSCAGVEFLLRSLKNGGAFSVFCSPGDVVALPSGMIDRVASVFGDCVGVHSGIGAWVVIRPDGSFESRLTAVTLRQPC